MSSQPRFDKQIEFRTQCAYRNAVANSMCLSKGCCSPRSPLLSGPLLPLAPLSSLSLSLPLSLSNNTHTPNPTPRFDKQIEFAFRVAICRPRGPDHRGGRERREDAGTQHVVLCSGGAGGPEHSTLSCVLAAGAGQNTAQCAVFRSPAGRKFSLDRKHYCMTQSKSQAKSAISL